MQRPPRPQRRNTQGFLSVLCELPPPLGVVLSELRRGSPKRFRREGGCVHTPHFFTCSGLRTVDMAYRLRRKKSPAIELSRVVTREFQKALEEIGNQRAGRTEAVHEARKHVKKIRAVLRLLQKKLGEG